MRRLSLPHTVADPGATVNARRVVAMSRYKPLFENDLLTHVALGKRADAALCGSTRLSHLGLGHSRGGDSARTES